MSSDNEVRWPAGCEGALVFWIQATSCDVTQRELAASNDLSQEPDAGHSLNKHTQNTGADCGSGDTHTHTHLLSSVMLPTQVASRACSSVRNSSWM